jgi:hypothetical protein
VNKWIPSLLAADSGFWGCLYAAVGMDGFEEGCAIDMSEALP